MNEPQVVVREDPGEPTFAITVYCPLCGEVLSHREFDVSRMPLSACDLYAHDDAQQAVEHRCAMETSR